MTRTPQLSRLRSVRLPAAKICCIVGLVLCLGTLSAAQTKESLATILVDGGSFQMGSNNYTVSNEGPAHTVTLPSYRLAMLELTVGQFRAFVQATGYVTTAETNGGAFVFQIAAGDGFFQRKNRNWKEPNFPQTEDCAVTAVSWIDAIHYCNWLSGVDGLTPVYRIVGKEVSADFSANGWRLPTEAEWEFAARGGTKSTAKRYAGSDRLIEVAWCAADSKWVTHPGKLKAANELGFYDMSGNVDEWCWDWYGSYAATAQTKPTGPETGLFRIHRGGNWYTNPELYEDPRTTFRAFALPYQAYNSSGIRLARNN